MKTNQNPPIKPEIHGAALSPFVRKTRIFHSEKGIAYKAIHADPNKLPESFKDLSPLMRVPCYVDEEITIADSGVICAYVERKHPVPALYPTEAALYAKALWFEKYADYELAPNTTFFVFRNRVVMPLIGKPCDEEKVARALQENLPPMYDYLQKELGDNLYMVGNTFGIADIAIATQFANLKLGGEVIPATGWPKLSAYIERLHNRESIKPLLEKELELVNSFKEKRANKS